MQNIFIDFDTLLVKLVFWFLIFLVFKFKRDNINTLVHQREFFTTK